MASNQIPKKVTQRVSLVDQYYNRGANSTKDYRLVNAFPETIKLETGDRKVIQKRPGITFFSDVAGNGEGRGLIWFYQHFYAIIGNTVYQITSNGATKVAKITLSTSTGQCGMIVANSSSLGDYLFIVDGTVGWIIESDGTATQITDTDFPTPHVPTPTFIDGYVMLAKGGDVFNCDLDNPLSWSPDQYLPAEMFPDPVVALARQANQVVCFGSESIEFFYDNANASGSPLSRNTGVAAQIGCSAPHAIYQNEQFCIFIGQSNSGGRAIWKLDGYTPKKISTEYVDRIIDSEIYMDDVSGFGFRSMGHLFFLINLPTISRTIVYDVDEHLWHEWSTNTGGSINLSQYNNAHVSHTRFTYSHATDTGVGTIFLLSDTTGDIYYLNPAVYLDGTSPIVVEARTNLLDFDSYNRKFPSNLKVVSDRYSTSNTIGISWSDDDYQTWSNNHQVELTDDFPYIGRLGAFRRRSWRITHVDNNTLRMEALELLLDLGIS
jgi:hypothetical protein